MIRVLSDIVQNKIAAGEVIERPASAVKELVENALDAGARRITIDVEEGGLRLLRVIDDGCGMSREDLSLSILRHATSKIHDVEDIFTISTMGFRGEALPSIAAVSRLTISTALKGDATGYALKVTGGRTEEVQPAPPRTGTSVEIGDLFFNIPARRKFMKSPAAEMGAINETVVRLALANPEVAFYVKGNGKKSLELPVHADLEERISALFGNEIELVPIDYTTSNGVLRITGFCSKPPQSKGTGKSIYTFLNKRWIKHPGISKSIVDAYQGNLPPRRYPFAVLNFTVNPAEVDVNAHPTKEVVRFENTALFVGGCRKAVAQTLNKLQGADNVYSGWREREVITPEIKSSVERYINSNRAADSSAKAVYKSSSMNSGAETGYKGKYSSFERNGKDFTADNFAENSGENNSFEPDKPVVNDKQLRLDIAGDKEIKFIGQAGAKYLIAEDEDGIVFFDQHALHERWNYNRLLGREIPVMSQRLLIPVEINLSVAEQETVEEALESLLEMGFEIDCQEDKLIIRAHPEIIRPHHFEQIVREVLADIEAAPIEEYKDRIRASLACRASVLFGTALSEKQCLELLKKLQSGELLTCPHGRPTRIEFSWAELAARFGR